MGLIYKIYSAISSRTKLTVRSVFIRCQHVNIWCFPTHIYSIYIIVVFEVEIERFSLQEGDLFIDNNNHLIKQVLHVHGIMARYMLESFFTRSFIHYIQANFLRKIVYGK